MTRNGYISTKHTPGQNSHVVNMVPAWLPASLVAYRIWKRVANSYFDHKAFCCLSLRYSMCIDREIPNHLAPAICFLHQRIHQNGFQRTMRAYLFKYHKCISNICLQLSGNVYCCMLLDFLPYPKDVETIMSTLSTGNTISAAFPFITVILFERLLSATTRRVNWTTFDVSIAYTCFAPAIALNIDKIPTSQLTSSTIYDQKKTNTKDKWGKK